MAVGQTRSFKMKGLSEMQRSLESLPDKLQERAMQNASAAGARVIRKEARRIVPVGRGPNHLRDDIVVSRTFKKRGRKQKLKGTVFLGIKDDGRFYAHLVEFGSSRQSAQPFMRPAFDNAFQPALQKMADKLAAEIAKQARKLTGWKPAKKIKRLTR